MLSTPVATATSLWLGGAALAVASACASLEASDDSWPGFHVEPPPTTETARALEFDGESHYATVGTAGFPFALDPHSIALWVRPARLEGVQNFVVLRKDFESGVQLGLQDGVPMAWRVFGGRPYVEGLEPLETGTWYHIAYVYDGTEHRLYVNAEEQAVGDLLPNNRTSTTGWLGTLDGRSELFSGVMDRVRVWNAARSEQDILEDARGEPPVPSGLVLDLSFDDPDGLRAYDRSGRGNHAILGDGFSQWAPQRVDGVRFE